MRNDRNSNYGEFSRRFQDQNPQSRDHNFRGNDSERGRWTDRNRDREEPYRIQKSQQYGQRGGERGMREDYYNQMYDTTNYTGVPREENYGLPYGSENDLDTIRKFPYSEGPYANRTTRYSYSQGYNPNYDNPEEGDMYRDFDSRGNHGYRHDMGYGSVNDFREFGNDHNGLDDRSDNYYGYFGGYNR
ncbi:hypothetical protein ACFSKU_16010 [Pontibacter silvestris]|uniref:Uncharacterized protein n=1 Tax=Pontibacter silvestris TaxID=2305183 RepID=A0ABW4X2L9_9BACT|nr:hypothetical protein [Pontibacter silvestris]MCC9135975.1 hypothetical protein [Pontibacter silvestris]